jgi:hypothetical protein
MRKNANLTREPLLTTQKAEDRFYARVGRSKKQCRLWKTQVEERIGRLTIMQKVI